ncbi:tetratricopeptide repeat protein [Labilibaculum manganireducens]|uniref:tetratricopeptide repeat-containing sensor histidine kinase n=1 Tax=Labilibaculum manganireducens TaxID=1940525 RepID=UPI0029F48897|nr:tetratricopeptide repeat protein [Labilibaculum manganireducens]
MKHLILLSLIYCLLPSKLLSSNFSKPDATLKIQLQSEIPITQILNKAEELRDSSYNESIKVGKQALVLALETNNSNILASAYKSLGETYLLQGIFDSSEYYYREAIAQYKIVDDSLNIGKITANIGIIYRRTRKYNEALQQYLKALSIYKSMHYEKGIGSAYVNIGGVHQTLGDFDRALEYYQYAQQIYEKLGNNKGLIHIFINIGVLYSELENHEQALSYRLRALDLNEETGNTQLKSTILLNIGESYFATNQPVKALGYLDQCEKLRIQLNDHWGMSKVFILKALAYEKINKNIKAEAYFKKSIQACIENQLFDDLKESYFFYSQFLEKRNHPKEAINYLKKYHFINDSLIAVFQNKAVKELTAKYESEQKEKELELLTQKSQIQNLEIGKKNSWIIILIIAMILGAVAIVVSLRINRLRADHKILNLRQKVLLTQMNPHFLFNSLTAIQSFILDKKNDEANNYLSRLASLVRGILENSREEFVTLRTELNTLKDYIGLQKLRFENEISYEFEIDKNIDQDQVLVPPMLAQPFVENALVHGMLRNNPHAKIQVKVSLTKNMDSVQFQIKDNGIGINEAKKSRTNINHKSIATSIALDRVKIYNFKSAKKMNFEIADLKNNDPNQSGTQVTYSIPINICSN